MSSCDSGTVHTHRLWGDFRMFLAGSEATDERIAAFVAMVENRADCDTYGLPIVGCGDAIVAELNRQIAAQM
ncbi:hypothetical protein AB4076_20310 [Dyella sp. 2RAF44]|jgi:hypothetical protein|uniref:hypothetical protein n=1 Tax=Dyella sp. 2RAF44 TaxID=3233000 RepID=UPI003F90F1EA